MSNQDEIRKRLQNILDRIDKIHVGHTWLDYIRINAEAALNIIDDVDDKS